jgi:hypothetical protein
MAVPISERRAPNTQARSATPTHFQTAADYRFAWTRAGDYLQPGNGTKISSLTWV